MEKNEFISVVDQDGELSYSSFEELISDLKNNYLRVFVKEEQYAEVRLHRNEHHKTVDLCDGKAQIHSSTYDEENYIAYKPSDVLLAIEHVSEKVKVERNAEKDTSMGFYRIVSDKSKSLSKLSAKITILKHDIEKAIKAGALEMDDEGNFTETIAEPVQKAGCGFCSAIKKGFAAITGNGRQS